MSYYIAEENRYANEEEAIKYAMRKHLGKIVDLIVEQLEKDLENKYVISFTFTLPTGQTVKVDAKLTRVSK